MTDELSKLFRDAMDWGRSYGQRLNTPYELLDEVATQFADKARAIEAAATAPLLERIAALEAKLSHHVPDDFLSHKASWRNALVLAEECADTDDDVSYWQHELSAYDKAHAALSAAPAAPEQQEPTPMEPFLLCDLSHELGVAVPILSQQIARNGLGNYSTNMALPMHVASAMRKIYSQQTEASAQAPNAQQADPYGTPMSERAAKLAADPVRGPRIAALREKLAQQAEAQEPCATFSGRRLTPDGTREFWGILAGGVDDLPSGSPLFARPQPAQLQALSEEEVRKACGPFWEVYSTGLLRMTEAIQSALATKSGAVLK